MTLPGSSAASPAAVTFPSMGVPEVLPGVFRVLVIGDSHGHAGMVARACLVASRLGAREVWSVGDFGVWPGRSGRGFLDSVEYDAAACGVTVRVVPGNHDDYDQVDAALALSDGGWAALRPHVLVARRGHVHRVVSSRVMCLSGAASIDGPGGVWSLVRGPGDGWWPQERISEEDVEVACGNIDAAGGIDMMVCHDVPDTVPMNGQRDFPLGEEVRARIRRVAEHGGVGLLLAGHWHRFVDRTVDGRRELVLSADINPEECQWVVVDFFPGVPVPVVHVPEWDAGCTLS